MKPPAKTAGPQDHLAAGPLGHGSPGPQTRNSPESVHVSRFTFGASRPPSWLICLFLVLATLAVYWPVRHFEFLNYDDDDGIVKSAMVRQGLSWRGVAYAFQNQHMGNWQPATTLSHMFDCQLFRLRPGPPHLHNLALHLANTLLLFFALQ